MAYKYQPIKDEIFVSDNEEEPEDDEEEEENNIDIADEFEGGDGQLNGDSQLNGEVEDIGVDQLNGDVGLQQSVTQNTVFIKVDGGTIAAELDSTRNVNQVIEQDGVLILETVDTSPNDPEGMPEGSTVLASGTAGLEMLNNSSMLNDSSMMDDSGMLNESSMLENSNILDSSVNTSAFDESQAEELEDCHLCGKKVLQLDKHILANHGEKVECQLCNQFFPVGNLRWHILKEHCHNKVTECSLCEQKFVTKNALKNHIKQVHLGETSTCHICHKEYKDLYHHVKYFHERIRNYECSYCEKKFQAKKLLYNHVQSIHLGEKTRCPDCHKDISVDNFSRHVRETHEKVRKPCPHCDKEFAMSNLSRHIRQVHNNESTECPECGKALTISNLNKHIKSVHKKLKKTCDICNEEVPYSSISVHKRKVHGIGKPMDDITPRGPNLKLRKRYRQMIENELEFDRLAEAGQTTFITKGEHDEEIGTSMEEEDDDMGDIVDREDEEEEELEEMEEQMATKTIKVGDKAFTFSFA